MNRLVCGLFEACRCEGRHQEVAVLPEVLLFPVFVLNEAFILLNQAAGGQGPASRGGWSR